MALSKSPDAFKLRTLFMGSLGEIPESHARTAGPKQLAARLKEGLREHPRTEKTLRPHRKGRSLHPKNHRA